MKKNTIISLKGVHKSYFLENETEVPVLRGVNLEIKKGEFIAIMGESGCGKTTLLNIIGCLHHTTKGRYYLDGEDIGNVKDDFTLAYIRNIKMGFIFQQFNLLSKLTAIENIILPAVYADNKNRATYQRANQLAESVGIQERMGHRPNELSGGQQQRISICRALINNPDIILADEPTGALDSSSGIEIMKIFTKLKKEKKTILMVTHTSHVAKYADRIIYMQDGVVVDENYKLKSNY